jgi:hypothetical protein
MNRILECVTFWMSQNVTMSWFYGNEIWWWHGAGTVGAKWSL